MGPTERLVVGAVSTGVGGGQQGCLKWARLPVRQGALPVVCEVVDYMKAQPQEVFGEFYSVEPIRLAL